ncbi:MAG TPA: GNAT family N-acetyltransferase [Gemmatimonadaceae bacterium]|nr:GNAT family N-acetyltransferase [Gemmatimonadaceae bacterium]
MSAPGMETIERATPADEPALLALINLIQPHVPWNTAHLRWQFFEPPAGSARLYVVRDGGDIISLYAAVPQRLRTPTGLAATWMIQDVMTRPDFRGRGLLHRLGARCLEEIRADGATGYTFPNKLSEGSFRRLGWTAWAPVPARSTELQARPERVAQAPVDPITGAFTDDDGAAWEASALGVGVQRDAAFLDWRYRKPGQTYDRYRVRGGRGFLVLKTYDAPTGRTVHLCDVVLRADARDALPALLRFVLAFAGVRGARRVTAWLPAGHPYADAFDDAGLRLDADVDRHVFLTGPTGVAPGAPWHLTQGDSDVY